MEDELMEVLACPKCKGDVWRDEDHLVCDTCLLRFRVNDGIPDMLIDNAETVE